LKLGASREKGGREGGREGGNAENTERKCARGTLTCFLIIKPQADTRLLLAISRAHSRDPPLADAGRRKREGKREAERQVSPLRNTLKRHSDYPGATGSNFSRRPATPRKLSCASAIFTLNRRGLKEREREREREDPGPSSLRRA